LLYMINHNFYCKLNNYANYKSKSLHDIIFTDITQQMDDLFLLKNIDNIYVNYHDHISNVLVGETKNILQKNDTFVDNLEKKNNLESEMRTLPANSYRNKEITDSVAKLNVVDPETQKNMNILDITTDSNEKMNLKKIKRLKSLRKTLAAKSSCIDIYDSICSEILKIDDSDYRTYTILWEKLFNQSFSDSTQIINKIFKSIMDNTDNNDIIQKAIDALQVICIDVDNYFSLPNEYNEVNYSLTEIMDIIIHVTKYTQVVNLYHMILKLLRSELISKIPHKSTESDISYFSMIDQQVKNIVTTKLNDISLIDYLFDILPEKLVKISLEIFEYDEDDDKNKSLIEVLSHIDKFISVNTTIQINKEDSRMLKLLSQNVYPYFKNYFEINIKKLKKIADGYYSMLNNFSGKLNILQKVLAKAQTEH